MIEVELKFLLPPEARSKLQEKLRTMKSVGTVKNMDIYYDTSAFDLLRQAVFVRIRNNNQLQVKFNEEVIKIHGQSIERTFFLPLEPAMAEKMNTLFRTFLPAWHNASTFEDAVLKNDLSELARIHNLRQEYSNDEIHLSIDSIEDLGDFLEVEVNVEEGGDTSHAFPTLQAFVSDLNLQRVKTGYVELWLYKYNPQAYQLGKYHL